MATEAEDPGFLSRWSRRKTLQRQGLTLEETQAVQQLEAVPDSKAGDAKPAAPAPTLQPEPAPVAREQATAAPAEPPPTLADVAALSRESDFSRFLTPGVQPEVKNAALAKLFTDPHFNVMDRLDVYIDDYGKPDPLPAGMLRQMLQAQVLGLFDDEEGEKQPNPQTPPVVTADAAAPTQPTEPAPDEDTDLQLQPDDGAGRAGPEAGAGEDAGQPH